MGHNNVVLGNSKYKGILRIDELSTGPPNLGCHSSEAQIGEFILDFGIW